MTGMPADLRAKALAAKGFMPEDEGDLLYDVAVRALADGPGLEVGTYCGKSAIYLGAAARAAGSTVFTVDHHRGSEENQAGWEYHDATLADPEFGRLDTLPTFRRTIKDAGLEEEVVAVVGRSTTVSALWRTPLALLFVDGGHTDEHAGNDYTGWGRWVRTAARWWCTTCSPTPRTAARRRTGSTCGRSAAASRRPTVLGSMRVLTRVDGDAGDPVS